MLARCLDAAHAVIVTGSAIVPDDLAASDHRVAAQTSSMLIVFGIAAHPAIYG
jgi:hypothetical protein